MASRGKKKTTMAKLTRESRLRERRIDKQARKDARKQGLVADQDQPGERLDGAVDLPVGEPAELHGHADS